MSLAVTTMGQLTAFGVWQGSLLLVGALHDWREAFRMIAFAAATLLPALILLLDCRRIGGWPRPPRERRGLLSWALIRFAGPGYALVGAAGTVMITTLPRMDAEPSSGWAIGVYAMSISAMFGRLVFAWRFDRGERTSSVLVASILIFVSIICTCASIIHPAFYITGVVLFGASYGGFLPVALVYLRMAYPTRQSDASLLMFFWGGLGVAIGAIASGVLSPSYSTLASLLVTAGAAAAGGLLWLWFINCSKSVVAVPRNRHSAVP